MFGYALGQKFWGHGFATEALTFLVDWALAQPGIYRSWAYCDAENPASVRVMEKAGMVREGVLRLARLPDARVRTARLRGLRQGEVKTRFA